MNTEVIILADGDFPSHKTPISYLNRAQTIICCDGAAKNLIEHSIIPNAIVGDMDSLPQEFLMKYASIIHKSEEQETNDLTKAFLYSLQFNPTKIIILGASGKREDHTLGNISLLSYYKTLTSAQIEMYTNFGVLIPITDTSFFDFKKGTQVSIFSLTPSIKIASKGLKYPLEDVEFDYWWKATLNEVSKPPFSLVLKSGKIIVFAAYN